MLESADLRFFAALTTEPSLAAAARALNVSAPAVSQRLAQIEGRLGLRLIERGRGRLVLTAEGEALLRRSDEILHRLAVLNEDMLAHRHQVSGPLRIIAPLGFGRIHVAPAVVSLTSSFPEITPDLVLSDDPYGAARADNWDIIVHIGQLADSSLTQKKLASNRRFLCASPAYLAHNGVPKHPGDLHSHSCGVIREDQADVTMWSVTGACGEHHSLRIRPAFASNDGEVIKSWAVAGMGIVQRSEWNVAAELADGRLDRVLESYALPDADIVAILNPRTLRSARVQETLDALTAHLSSVPWR
ncbi:LysR family transcriptional regulator [Leisingera sp. ANG-Vp]|uniref:LysR family transcriptional regulator n=1 Tax=Leisingera sp. ANG-Vp TaxID=1577896 RepID=UPI00057E8175|nr:LysR family transcriptional regulator [Leisingera sp. ANG-Vp]KIC20390.1 LysR family transcriptional regulator [Leisingera sp. ANG-Vp]